MHELSVAHSLVEIAEQTARAAHAERVTAVHLRLGALAGVQKEALLFCYDLATAGTLLAGSRLVVEEVPVRVQCEACDGGCALPDLQDGLRCPRRAGRQVRVTEGRDLQLDSLECEP